MHNQWKDQRHPTFVHDLVCGPVGGNIVSLEAAGDLGR